MQPVPDWANRAYAFHARDEGRCRRSGLHASIFLRTLQLLQIPDKYEPGRVKVGTPLAVTRATDVASCCVLQSLSFETELLTPNISTFQGPGYLILDTDT